MWGNWIVFAVGVALGLLAGLFGLARISPTFRARNQFRALRHVVLLALCATVAILTTIGIVFSVLFETYRFFFDPALKGGRRHRVPVRHRVEPAGGAARRPGRHQDGVRLRAAARPARC